MLSLLRQPRYLGLFGVCAVIAIVCGLAGSWQVIRFDEKRSVNHELRVNNRQKLAVVGDVLGPASAPISDGKAQEFRHVRATGTYLANHETLVRAATVGDDSGYLVLTPLQTANGVLLVARGFVKQTQAAADTPTVAAPPSGQVDVSVRLEPVSKRNDKFGLLPSNQVDVVNAAQQAARIGQPVWNAYAELLDGEAGTSGLTVIPDPDMSNPAGGAVEPQHAAYVVQWFLFGLGALSVPFVMARAEHRRGQGPRGPSLDDRLAGNV